MRKNVKLTAVAVCLCLLAVSLSALAVFNAPVQGMSPVPSPSQSLSVYDMPKDGTYLVTILDGYVAVYFGDSTDIPVETTEIRAGGLRLADQEMLRQGVVLQGLESLSHFLEDFSP